MALIINDSWRINASVVDVNPTVVALTGDNKKFILGYSNAKASMSLNTQGAVFAEDFYAILNGNTKIWGTEHTFEKVESKYFTFFAEEDNGNVHKKHLDLDTIDYIKPTCNIASELPDGEGKMNVYAYGVFFDGSFGAVSNTITVQYRYKVYGGTFGEWHDMSIQTDRFDYAAQALVEGLDYKKAYVFEARVIDKLEEISSGEIIVKSVPVFHWGENDFVFEVPVTFKMGADGITPANEPLSINGKTYDGSASVNAEISNGTWLPTLNIPENDFVYNIRQGWYQKVGRVVTIGWNLTALIDPGYENTQIIISGVPFIPTYQAFGGGVAYNIKIAGNLNFECWCINATGQITPRLQPCNNTTAGNLNISSTSYYPGGGASVTLSGTICYIV
jgi:hypothetical protein